MRDDRVMSDQLQHAEMTWKPGPPVTFAGFRTMWRFPAAPSPATWAGVRVAVVGIPFDTATTYRPGARFGPAAVREASLQISASEHYPTGIDLGDMSAVDTGDIELNLHQPMGVTDQITNRIRDVLAAGCLPLSIGGDHYVTYPILRAINELHGPIAIVHFDAHTDTWEFGSEGEINHGSMFTYALREGLIDAERSIQVGIRTFNPNTRGLKILDAPWVRANGTDATVAAIREQVGDGPAYFTFDIDCLDPSFAPGTGTPVPGGLTTGNAIDIISGLGGINWVGADVVEVAPAYDSGEVTALAGATIAGEWLALIAASDR
jgi:agmatinase